MIINETSISEELKDVLEKFYHVRIASRNDAKSLALFIKENAMKADGLGISFSRGQDYFSLLEMQSEVSLTLILESKGEVLGVGSLTCRKAYIRGHEVTVGYLQDLRIASRTSGSLRSEFFDCFSEIIRVGPSLPDLHYCQYYYTAILDKNQKALQSLSRNRMRLEYTRIFRYNAQLYLNILPKNFAHSILRPLLPTTATSWTEAYDFYKENIGTLSYDLSLDDIKRLEEHSTVIGVRSDEKIVGVCLLVNPEGIRDLSITGRSDWLKFDLKGAYISAIKVSKSLPLSEQSKIKRRLILTAKAHPLARKKDFVGYIQSERELEVKIPIPKVITEGSIYRVFHEDHTKLDKFSEGFLRPNHIGYFDWSLS